MIFFCHKSTTLDGSTTRQTNRVDSTRIESIRQHFYPLSASVCFILVIFLSVPEIDFTLDGSTPCRMVSIRVCLVATLLPSSGHTVHIRALCTSRTDFW